MKRTYRAKGRIGSYLATGLLLLVFCITGNGPGKVTAAGPVTVQFEQDYVQVGEPLQVSVSGAAEGEEFTYEWYVNDQKSSVTQSSFTADESMLEKMIRAEVYEKSSGTSLGGAEIFCSRIPVIYIDTENGVGITSKETYVNADMKIQGNETYGEEAGLYDGAIEIRGRGNATWGNPKKPYKLKLGSSTDLFGMGSSKHWVLLANYNENSLLRNKVSYDLSGKMGLPYMQSVHVGMILNGKYLGNYLLCEQVKLEEDRVNVESFEAKIKAAAKAISKKTGVDKDSLEDAMMTNLEWVTSDSVTFEGNTYRVSDYYGPIDITGGYLVELDYYDDEVSQIITSGGKRVKFKDPEYAVTNEEVYGYVSDYVNAFEAAVESEDFHTDYQGTSVHYSELFDMDSLVKFWLMQEIFFNWDGMNNSNYMYKDVGGLMHFGPIWDMDLTAGNGGTSSTTTWQTFGFDFWQHPNQWYRHITQDPYFIVQACQYYHSIRGTLLEDMLKEISDLGTMLEEAGKANKIMWANSDNYASSVQGFKSWMERHLAWMDQQFSSPEQMIRSLGQYQGYTYAPDSRIAISVDESGEQVKASVSVEGMDSICYYVNGQFGGSADVAGGKAELNVANEALNDDGTSNTILVCSSAAKGVSNFAVFDRQREPDRLKGNAVISGITRVYGTLKADVSDTNDTVAAIQWLADGEVIEGANGTYFCVTPDLTGKALSVVVTGEHLEGEIVSEKTEKITAPGVQKDHLIIHQVYGGGGSDQVPVSHSFIELYNPTAEEVELTGYEIGYLSNRSSSKAGSTGGSLHKLQLSGRLPSKASYLIRCGQEDTTGAEIVLQIAEADQEWNQTIDNKMYQVILLRGGVTVDAVSVNEADVEGRALADPVGDEILSKKKCIRRVGYVDTDDNTADFEVLNLTNLPENILEAIRPLSLSDYVPEKKPDKEPEKEPDRQEPQPGTVKAVLNASQLKLQKKQTARVLKLERSSVPGDAVAEWVSSDPKIVSINKKTGKMTGKRIGTAVITARLKSGGSAECKIKVIKQKVATKRLVLSKTKLTLKKGRSYRIRIKTRVPLTANDKITYRSKKPNVAAVSAKGRITARAKGSSVIIVKAESGRKKTIKVTVK